MTANPADADPPEKRSIDHKLSDGKNDELFFLSLPQQIGAC